MKRKTSRWKILIAIGILIWAGLGQSTAAEEEDRTISEALQQDNEAEGTTNTEAEAANNEDRALNEDTQLVEDRSAFAILLQLVLALGAVIAIMYFLLKFINKRTQRFQSNQTMQNLGGVPLGQNKSVQLIKVGDRLLVVGVGDSIQLLKEIENEELEELLSSYDGSEPSWGEKGASYLSRLLKKSPSHDESETSSFQKVFKDQLGEMKQTRKKARHRLKEYD
ncbi:flagellar biosynthetic protein FliO [Alteribacillus sp. JSM 102045]|uniref:flagellar biosynthetic protein FliO n=1 Tax=Alteribacillus sp. JSM 102045 TaxID=1562101 RepID=UPI0035C1913B